MPGNRTTCHASDYPRNGRSVASAASCRPWRSCWRCSPSGFRSAWLIAFAWRLYARIDVPDAGQRAGARRSRRSSTTTTARRSGRFGDRPIIVAAGQVPDHVRRRCSRPRTAASTSTAASRRRASPGRSGTTCAAEPRRAARRSPSSRQERLPDPGAHLHAQGQGVLHRGQARAAAMTRTRSSRTTSTPSTSAAAPTASRPRRRPTSAVPARSLTVEQAAVLAAVIRSPGRLRPGDQPDRLQARWDYVLDGMVKRRAGSRQASAGSCSCRRR